MADPKEEKAAPIAPSPSADLQQDLLAAQQQRAAAALQHDAAQAKFLRLSAQLQALLAADEPKPAGVRS